MTSREVPMLTVNLVDDDLSDSVVDLEWVDEFDLMPIDSQVAFIEQLIEVLELTLEWIVDEDSAASEIADEDEEEEEDEDA